MFAKQKRRWVLYRFPAGLVVLLAGIPVAHADSLAMQGAVDAGTLEAQRAMYNVPSSQWGRLTSNAQLADTQMQGEFASGDNILGSGAFDHAQGISTVIQNSGHNVIIQESLILNVNVAP